MAKTLSPETEVTRVSLPIEKWEEDKEGNLVVYGKATTDALDSDRQRVDKGWAGSALDDWHATGGNIRVQHNPSLYPAGKSIGLEITADGHYVKGLVIEPTAQKLVKHGVLAAYSIGVAEPVIDRSAGPYAPGGVIKGGRIVEVSLVDRPANPDCYLTLAKSEDSGREWSEGDLAAALAEAEAAEAGKADAADEGDVAKPDLSKDDEDGDGDTGADGPDQDGEGDSHGDDASKSAAPDTEGMSAVAAATPAQRKAYLDARAEWLAAEPVNKSLTGTEYLQTVSAWKKWDAEGTAEGLDATEEGASRWLAKNAGAVDAAGAEAELADDALAAVAQAEAVKLAQAYPDEPADLDKKARAFSAEQRRQYAKEGKALPDGSYPVPDEDALRRAAVLARSGHGDVAAAKRLIARRAKELGVSNPLDDGADAGKADSGDSGGKCKTCKGTGKIKGGNVVCPTCKGKSGDSDDDGDGKASKSGAEEAAAAAVTKAVGLGLISQATADEILAQIGEGKASRPLPATTEPAGTHREPDGTTSVERIEPQAGLGTDPDPVPDKIPPSVAAGGQKSDTGTPDEAPAAPYALKRAHDALCAAYDVDDVLGAYPSLKSAAAAIDPAAFEGEVAEAAEAVKGTDPDVFADARALLHKAFADQYPSVRLRPGDAPAPGSYHRPYLSAGHAAEHAAGSASIPSGTHTPEPQQFTRGNLTAGHQAASPGDHGPNNPAPPDASGRSYYSTAEQEMAAAAMRSVHDHIAAQYAGACPMAPSRQVMPDGMGAGSTLSPGASFPNAGGFADGSRKADAGGTDLGGSEPVEDGTVGDIAAEGDRRPQATGISQDDFAAALKAASEAGAAAALKALNNRLPDPAAVTTLVAEQVRDLRDHMDNELGSLRKELDELGEQPDPALSPVRGQMARPGTSTVTAVQKRSLVDEAGEARRAAQAAEHDDFMRYLQAQAASPDPKVREKAMTVLDKMAGTALPA